MWTRPRIVLMDLRLTMVMDSKLEHSLCSNMQLAAYTRARPLDMKCSRCIPCVKCARYVLLPSPNHEMGIHSKQQIMFDKYFHLLVWIFAYANHAHICPIRGVGICTTKNPGSRNSGDLPSSGEIYVDEIGTWLGQIPKVSRFPQSNLEVVLQKLRMMQQTQLVVWDKQCRREWMRLLLLLLIAILINSYYY